MFFNAYTRTHIRRAEQLRIRTDVPTARRTTMEPTSRRQFLKRSSAVAAAAGVAAAVPVSAAKVLSSSDKSHLADREPELPDDPGVDVPVVAHVHDVRKGLVSLYTGEREVKIKNKRLAAALYHATH
jgi:hypothetical protein